MRLVILALALAGGRALAQDQPPPVPILAAGEALIEVAATGTVRAKPDIVTFQAGAVTVAPAADAALMQNSRTVERLIEAVRAAGVRSADLRTRDLRVEPRFAETQRDEDASRIIGYVARNTLEIRIRDLAVAPKLLSTLLAVGANDLSGPNFELSDAATARQIARTRAIEQAWSQARDYAAALRMRVARVVRVSEKARRVDRNGTIVVTGSMKMGVPLEPGEIETAVDVFVDFALLPAQP